MARALSSPTRRTFFRASVTDGEEGLGHISVHDQGLGRVANTRALGFPIDEKGKCHFKVGRRVDVQMAIAVPVDDIGDRGVLEDGIDQGGATSRDQAVDRPAHAHELSGRSVTGVLHEDEAVLGKPSLGEPLAENGGDRLV